jgi:hypothetical protein
LLGGVKLKNRIIVEMEVEESGSQAVRKAVVIRGRKG